MLLDLFFDFFNESISWKELFEIFLLKLLYPPDNDLRSKLVKKN